MKRLFPGLALVVVIAAATAATSPSPPAEPTAPFAAAPAIALRLNGRSPGAEAFELTPGEPVIVEVQLRHTDWNAKEPIRLEPSSGSWAGRVKIVVTAADGRIAAWPFAVTGKPSAGGLSLQPATVTTLVLCLDQAARTAVAPGSYQMSARLDLGDGRGFRGTVDSEPANVNVVAAPTALVGAALGRRQLLRVRDALLHGDVAGAEAAAKEMLRAEPRRPEGFLGLALVHEARGERSRAILAAEMAISCAMGGDELAEPKQPEAAAPPPPAPKPPPKPVPVEYYELLDRLERLPLPPSGQPT